jgi:hypothetical protein
MLMVISYVAFPPQLPVLFIEKVSNMESIFIIDRFEGNRAELSLKKQRLISKKLTPTISPTIGYKQ